MGKIESVKQNIRQLDAGSFQNLCDAYLSKKGYPNIMSLGGEAGTRKTTLGTPDTYFIMTNKKYVFVEYTTQKSNVFKKLKDDIEKCLDTSRTGISHEKISEIIYCHISSNITPSQDNELRILCEKVAIKLTLIGIDKLAEDIYLFHHNLSRDFLGISISTDQIQSCDDFIKRYNSNRMAAPIDTKFLFREKEFKDIDAAYLKADVVILSGAAGAGKTRLALHYAEKHLSTDNVKVLCIHSNALPIYQDLKLFIDCPGNYFLFIDDANQLSGLQHVIHYVTMKLEGYNVKILITVRDYALQKVINDVREIANYEIVKIDVFKDNEIKELLETSLGILNQNYHERIIRIAEGNARIAILAGSLACNSNSLSTIDDVSQLYADYYGSYLEGNLLFSNENMYVTAGVTAFLEVIHLDKIDTFLPILVKKGLNRNIFIENIRILHEREIVDLYHDKVVRFSEQCLSNYLLKYAFYDKKILSLSEFIKTCFQNHRERTISSVNTLLNIFRDQTLFDFIEKEIKVLWNELSTEKSPDFFEFVKAFFRINPTETLLILRNLIDFEERVICEPSDIDIEKGKNYKSVTNDIINILGGFADANDLPTACDLLFQYYLKRPDLHIEFYHAINRHFGINKDSFSHCFYTQITFFEKVKEYSDDWQQEFIVLIFLDIASEFLKLYFSPAEGVRKNKVTIYQIPLTISEGTEKYRMIIWESLLNLSKYEKYRKAIRKILSDYGSTIEEVSIPVLQFDLKYIKQLIESGFPAEELENCIIANHIVDIAKRKDSSYESLFSNYLKTERFRLYNLLKGSADYEMKLAYKESKKLKQQLIEQYVSNGDLDMFKRLIDVCADISESDNRQSWAVRDGLQFAFEVVNSKKDYFPGAIKYYIEKDTPTNLHPNCLIGMLFSKSSDSEVYKIVNNGEYYQKNMWLYAYYHELPKELITIDHLHGVYDFLRDTSDKDIISSLMRDVNFLEKYNIIDGQSFITGCKIILGKMAYSPLIVNIYFGLLFDHHCNTPQQVIQKFSDDLELLEEIYCALLLSDSHYDYDGIFLKEIYLVKPTILYRYLEHLINNDSLLFSNYSDRYHCFFELDNFIVIYNKIFDWLIDNYQLPKLRIPLFLETLLLPNDNDQNLLSRQDEWIRQCILLHSNDITKMYCLFSVLSKFKIKRKKEYFSLFLKSNSAFEDFQKIPLTPTSYDWSGSLIPTYQNWIDFLKSLLPNLIGLKWIKHKDYVEKRISYLKQEIEAEQIDEILRG